MPHSSCAESVQQNSVDGLIQDLNDKQMWNLGFFNSTAAELLAQIGAPAENRLSEIIRMGSPNERRSAVWALTKFNDVSPSTINQILQVLADNREQVETRYGAAEFFRLIGTEGAQAISILTELAGDPKDPLTEKVTVSKSGSKGMTPTWGARTNVTGSLKGVDNSYLLKSIALKALRRVKGDDIPNYKDVWIPLENEKTATSAGPKVGPLDLKDHSGAGYSLFTRNKTNDIGDAIFFDGLMVLDGQKIQLNGVKPRYFENRDSQVEYQSNGDYYVYIRYLPKKANIKSEDTQHPISEAILKVKKGNQLTIMHVFSKSGC